MVRLIDLLFPKNCAGCYVEGSWICPKCYRGLTQKQQKIIKKSIYINRIYSLFLYNDKTVDNILHRFKYLGIKDYAEVLARLIFNKNKWLKDGDYYLVPVPIHRAKERIRGYNQTYFIATALAEISKSHLLDIVLKKYPTKSQTKLTKQERKVNIKGSFELIDKSAIEGRKIIIIDDVITTGATLNEAAKQIQKGKPQEILAITVAVD